LKLTEHFKNPNTQVSFEILPPLKGRSIQSIYEVLDPLMDFKPPFINVTYHRAEYKNKLNNNDTVEKIAIRKRPGTVSICAAIMYKYGIDAVPHLICGGFTKDQTEDALIDLHFLGVDNVLALRGDAMKSETTFHPEPGGNRYAIELVEQLQRMNKGIYLEEDLRNGNPTDFCIGVAGYPEKHFEASSKDTDLMYLKAKVDAGADFIVTQMFYDNHYYYEFVNKCRAAGITVPIIPGLKPLTKKSQAQKLPSIFQIGIPLELQMAFEKAKDDQAATEIGIDWCIQQSKDLLRFGVPCLHYYVMSNVKEIYQIVNRSI